MPLEDKLDENMPRDAAQGLRDLGHDVDTALDEGLGGKNDLAVWAATQADGRFFVTHDLDFSDVRKFPPGTHHGILLVRLEDLEKPDVPELLAAWFATESVETWADALVVATSRKIRVVRRGPEAQEDSLS